MVFGEEVVARMRGGNEEGRRHRLLDWAVSAQVGHEIEFESVPEEDSLFLEWTNDISENFKIRGVCLSTRYNQGIEKDQSLLVRMDRVESTSTGGIQVNIQLENPTKPSSDLINTQSIDICDESRGKFRMKRARTSSSSVAAVANVSAKKPTSHKEEGRDKGFAAGRAYIFQSELHPSTNPKAHNDRTEFAIWKSRRACVAQKGDLDDPIVISSHSHLLGSMLQPISVETDDESSMDGKCAAVTLDSTLAASTSMPTAAGGCNQSVAATIPTEVMTLGEVGSNNHLVSLDKDGDSGLSRAKLDTSVFDGYCPFVFLRTHGGDTGIVTEGMYQVLGCLHRHEAVYTCHARRRRIGYHPNSRPIPTLVLLHIQQKDKWTCGYRNLQMMLAALVPMLPCWHPYVLNHSANLTMESDRIISFGVPSQSEIEQELEASWNAGYDPRGAKHYGGRVCGQKKWIGAVEVWSILAAAGVDACVVQFINCVESRKLLGHFCSLYFSDACTHCNGLSSSRAFVQHVLNKASVFSTQPASVPLSCECPHLPLYLQWNGHSVTIVGVEHSQAGHPTNLLILDPAMSGAMLHASTRTGDPKVARLSLNKLRYKDCQIIVTSRRVATATDQEVWKQTINCVTASVASVKKSMECGRP